VNKVLDAVAMPRNSFAEMATIRKMPSEQNLLEEKSWSRLGPPDLNRLTHTIRGRH
jgi:hypothetical protein